MLDLSRREFGGIVFGATALAAMPGCAAMPYNWGLGFQTPQDNLEGELQRISGRLPADLNGVLFRNGPAQFERDGVRLGHWFDGDGMIQRFAISDGKIRHRAKFVMTDKRRDEIKADRFLYSGFGFAPPNPKALKSANDLNAANTSVIKIGSEVWALWEGGSPWRVDGDSLATIGRKTFPGEVDGVPFSAHPKQGPDGEIWNFGGFGNRCVIWQLARDGALKNATLIELPSPSLMHDFAVTKNHVVLLMPPLLWSGGGASTLIDQYSWQADKPFQVLVMDKNDLSKRRLYELPAKYMFHMGNAWEDGDGVIRVDSFMFNDSRFATNTARELLQGQYSAPPESNLTMVTLYPDGRARLDALSGIGEFPRMDPRRVGHQHRYTYGISGSGVARWDWKTGRRSRYHYGADYWAEEPVFAPNPNRTGEDDGWVIATVLNTRKARTELSVFDARHIDAGPIATFACPYALPLGFHGIFAAA
ncbi:MAG: carotenoid oxygenase [Alphaproteobacteria bacterium]|nr:carotenoid oxygenase [Alphaproteobacteria bacterium]